MKFQRTGDNLNAFGWGKHGRPSNYPNRLQGTLLHGMIAVENRLSDGRHNLMK
jgi:hypothetical protein